VGPQLADSDVSGSNSAMVAVERRADRFDDYGGGRQDRKEKGTHC